MPPETLPAGDRRLLGEGEVVMDWNLAAAVLNRWVHILSAIVAVGGMFFLRFVLLPSAAESLTPEQQAALRGAVLRRWRKVVGIGIGLLLLTGFYNFMTISIARGKEVAAYHPLFGVKFLLALFVFFIASALVGSSPALAAMRTRAPLWLAISAVSAVAIILISSILKNLGP